MEPARQGPNAKEETKLANKETESQIIDFDRGGGVSLGRSPNSMSEKTNVDAVTAAYCDSKNDCM